MTIGAFLEGFFDNFIYLIRYMPGYAYVSKLLTRSMFALLGAVGFGKLFNSLLLFFFDLLLKLFDPFILLKNDAD